MEKRINDRNVGLTPKQRDLINRRIELAFDQFAGQIHSVSVSLNDANGPKGGEDILCQVIVRLNGEREIVVKDTGSSVEAVVTDVVDRASFAISRRFERRKDSQGTSMSGL